MLPKLDASFYVEEAPEFEYRDGLFRVIQTVGGYRFERVMRPHVFMVALRKAAECARKHKFGGAEVVALFPEHEAATG